MPRLCLAPLGALVFVAASIQLGRAEPPQIVSLTPLGIPPHGEIDLLVAGDHLSQGTRLWVDRPADSSPLTNEEGQDNHQRRFRLSLQEPVSPGVVAVRVVNLEGSSAAKLLLIDDLPSVVAAESRHDKSTAQELSIPCAVDGTLEPRRLDYYSLPTLAGESVSIEVWARRLGSPADPSIRIFNAAGREIAYSDDEPGLEGDCRLRFVPPKDGVYLVEVRDVRYDGGEDYRYRLRIGTFPLVTVAYPLAVGPFTPTVSLEAADSSETTTLDLAAVPLTKNPSPTIAAGQELGEIASFARVGQTNLLEQEEVEGNDDWEHATAFSIPGGMNGRLHRREDRDCYVFPAKAGTRFLFSGSGRELGSSADLYLRLYDSQGNQLQEVDDTDQREGVIDFSCPTDGEYRLLVEDLTRGGGPGFVYRIEAVSFEPTFSLQLERERFHAPQAGVFVAKVKAARSGYDGAIEIHVEGLPVGCAIEQATIAAGQNETMLNVRLPETVASGALFDLTIAGHARIGESDRVVIASAEGTLREQLAGLRYPSRNLSERVLLTVGPEFPEFFQIKVATPAVTLARLVGKADVRISLERSDGFDGEAQLEAHGAPHGFAIAPVKVDKGQSEGVVSIVVPPALAVGTYTFQLRGQAIFRDQPREVFTGPISVRVIDPFLIHVEEIGELRAGESRSVNVRIEREIPGDGELQLTWHGLPEGVNISPDVVQANQTEMELTVEVADAVRPKKYRGVYWTAETSVAGQALSIAGPRMDLEIVK